MDFNSDQLFDGRRIRTLTIMDAFNRLSPAINVCETCRGTNVVVPLEKIDRILHMCRGIRDPTTASS